MAGSFEFVHCYDLTGESRWADGKELAGDRPTLKYVQMPLNTCPSIQSTNLQLLIPRFSATHITMPYPETTDAFAVTDIKNWSTFKRQELPLKKFEEYDVDIAIVSTSCHSCTQGIVLNTH
jgi:hypothetical protein